MDRRALLLLPALIALGCGQPEIAYLERPGARVALSLVDQTPPSRGGLGPEGLAAYRSALEARLDSHLAPSEDPSTATLRVVLTGLREAEYQDPGVERLVDAALTRDPVIMTLSLAHLETRTQAKLASLGYAIRVPEASFAVLAPGQPGQTRFRPISADAVILAHPKLMHGERGAEQRLKAEAEAFAAAVEAELARAYRWPRRG